ncbi:MAG: acyltransferase family protein [Pseudomonadota bacterium]
MPELPYPFEFLFSYYNLIFLAGIAAAYAYPHVPPAAVWPLGLAGVGLFFGPGIYEILAKLEFHHGLRTVGLGICAGMVITALARNASLSRWQTPRWLVFLGDASYAIYLAHVPAMTAGSIIIVKLGLTWIPPLPMFLICVAIGTTAGIATHLIVERPAMAAFRRWHARPAAEVRP